MSETLGLSVPPPPPPGFNYIEAVRPALTYVLVLTPLGAALLPLIIALFIFSQPRSRRHPVFILNVLACCSGIVEAALNAALEYKQLIFPNEPYSISLLICVTVFGVGSPVFIDSILLFRMAAFYPKDTTPLSTLVAVYAFPAVVKSVRLAVVIAYLSRFTRAVESSPNLLVAALSTWPKNPYIISEWTMQMADNAYASAIFLHKLWRFHRGKKDVPVIRSESFLSRVRSLFFIALSNFIFPVIMNIVQIVLIITDPDPLRGTCVLLANTYVAILGVVFATIWARRESWNEHSCAPYHTPGPLFDSTINSRFMMSSIAFGPLNEHDQEFDFGGSQ